MLIEYHGSLAGGQDVGAILALLGDCDFHYVLNHIDYATKGGVRPPFQVPDDRMCFALVYLARC